MCACWSRGGPLLSKHSFLPESAYSSICNLLLRTMNLYPCSSASVRTLTFSWDRTSPSVFVAEGKLRKNSIFAVRQFHPVSAGTSCASPGWHMNEGIHYLPADIVISNLVRYLIWNWALITNSRLTGDFIFQDITMMSGFSSNSKPPVFKEYTHWLRIYIISLILSADNHLFLTWTCWYSPSRLVHSFIMSVKPSGIVCSHKTTNT